MRKIDAELIVNEILQDRGVKLEDINDDSTFKDLGQDSLDLIEIIMEVEEILSINIDDDILSGNDNVSKLAEYILEVKK